MTPDLQQALRALERDFDNTGSDKLTLTQLEARRGAIEHLLAQAPPTAVRDALEGLRFLTSEWIKLRTEQGAFQ
jgi:hypothetical protein